MGYEIRAFIARAGTFVETQALSPCITVAPLNQGFELLYKDDLFWSALEKEAEEYKSEIDYKEQFKGFSLPNEAIPWALRLSYWEPIAYVAADFAGGIGLQDAIVWRDGQIALLPITNGIYNYDYKGRGFTRSDAPINSALRFLGVQKETSEDEFEAVGLNQCRDREGWVYKFNQGYAESGCKSIYDMDYEG